MSTKLTQPEDFPASPAVGVTEHSDAGTLQDSTGSTTKPSILDSSFPVLLPYDVALFMEPREFDNLIKDLVGGRETSSSLKRHAESETGEEPSRKAPFIEGLERYFARTAEDLAKENKALTQNADVTYISSNDPLVDLFYDLGQEQKSSRLKALLEAAWTKDPLATLKIIFNARSIHLGKSNKIAAYRALGWLFESHPYTLLTNLVWLTRPVIEKKSPTVKADQNVEGIHSSDQTQASLVVLGGPKRDEQLESEDFDIIDAEEAVPIDGELAKDEGDASKENPESLLKAHDVRFGTSHGYYKDLLNILVFAANDQLRLDGDPSSMLTQKQDKSSGWRARTEWDPSKAKAKRQAWRKQQHERVTRKLKEDPYYRALHLTVARIFAYQLQEDRQILDSGDKSKLRNLSLAAKWVPTFGEFHDKWTMILTSIAEILAPKMTVFDSQGSDSERETYLRHAREHFRREYSSPLRKALSVVERDIASQNFANIDYERVPSLAMDRYSKLFTKKDQEHFFEYITKVVTGKAKISGATLIPSTLVVKARSIEKHERGQYSGPRLNVAAFKEAAEAKIGRGVIEGQWKTLVQRIKDSGSLSSSIAVCDVSGSMSSPMHKDRTTPMDSAIGLSLLVAEVTAPPFGGGFISFDSQPRYISVGGPEDARGLVDKVHAIENTDWGYSTNFVAVFEDVILPMAVANKLTQEQMVKQIFVFSDMQFDHAETRPSSWTTSYERVQQKYREYGYEMPKLVFWNLADAATSKPVTMESQNTSLVSGYSQGMLKVFLDGGRFEGPGDVVETVEGDDGVVQVEKKANDDPLALVMKAVSHPSYAMLKIVD